MNVSAVAPGEWNSHKRLSRTPPPRVVENDKGPVYGYFYFIGKMSVRCEVWVRGTSCGIVVIL